MANISVSHTFVNSTTADASQVNTCFQDIISGTSDGTKDFSISALTVGGTLTANGNVTLGNASSDDLTVTASLASSLAIKTTATYNVGSSTLGLLSVYLGNSTFTTRLLSGASASWSMTLPATAGTARYRLETDGAGATSWHPVRRSSSDIQNISLAASVGSSALTITLKSADGTDLSSTNPADIVFRSATATTGTASAVSVTSNLTLTVSSGSTLGTTSAINSYLYIYAINNAGTVELAISKRLFSELSIVSTTAEGGAGAADSDSVLYSTTARTNVACKLIGRISSTQATAGTWATTPSEVSLTNFNIAINAPERAKYTHSAGQSIADNTITIVDFANKVFDSQGSVTTGGSWKFTAKTNDVFNVSATVSFDSNAEEPEIQLRLYKNGSFDSMLDYRPAKDFVDGTNGVILVGGSTDINLVVGDYIDIRIYQNNTPGNAISLAASGEYNHVSIHRVL